ncbi:MAG: putative transposase [Eubacteriaceae bacterium]|nr:putative transposase [Eubacteriaceae bacterium]
MELKKRGYQASRRRIGRIMKQKGLVSTYTVAQFRPHIDHRNESKAANLVNRKFNEQPYLKVVVSDSTYVRVGSNWYYICVLIDNTLSTFGISRSLSMKGGPYDNAVAEATFKIIKTEFVRNHTFDTFYDLNYQLAD